MNPSEQNSFQLLVNSLGGPDNVIIKIRTSKLDLLPAMLGLPFAFKSSSDEQIDVDARIKKDIEELYSFEHGYKVVLVCDDINYGEEKFYQSDLYSIITDDKKVQRIRAIDPTLVKRTC